MPHSKAGQSFINSNVSHDQIDTHSVYLADCLFSVIITLPVSLRHKNGQKGQVVRC